VTTADILIGLQGFGSWLLRIEGIGKKIALQAADWIVDRSAWAGRELRRIRSYPIGSRRASKSDRGISVWEYLHSVPLEELRYEQKPRGQHRDRRDWRSPGSSVASLIERIEQNRAWDHYWKCQIDGLMEEIQYMLSHPPLPSSVTVHGCQDCLCGQIADLRAEALT